MPGTDELDPELTALANVAVPTVHELFAYLQLGGLHNYEHALRFLSDHLLTTGFGYDAPAALPRTGIYHPDVPDATLATLRARFDPDAPTIGILFYRAHLLSGNIAFVDALIREIERHGANALPVFTTSSKEESGNGQSSQHSDPHSTLSLPLRRRQLRRADHDDEFRDGLRLTPMAQR